ncbi:MAG: peptidylprolyl isomerase [Porticoccaceae bacterium]|nr:peptidylprolyl isomerase [Porticoccaceae bacterium]
MTKTPITQSKPFILLLSIALALSAGAYWLTKPAEVTDPSLAIDALTNPDSEALQQLINNQLFGDSIVEAPGIGADIDSTTDRSAMQAKLAGLTKNVTTQQLPTAAELEVFYQLSKQRYRNPSKFWFEVISFATAKHGGKVFQMAEQALNAEQTPVGDRRDQYAAISSLELETVYGQNFVDRLMAVEQKNADGQSLPCWYGPISSPLGAHLVCVERVVWGDYQALEEVENQLINDWRFSVSQ